MSIRVEKINFNENGLIPAIVQDDVTGKVLMLAYMNKEAVEKTLETNEAWFYSRSRQELWHKGATSGNIQKVKRMLLDCDQDTILLHVIPKGPACHTGKESCFYETVYEEEPENREIVYDVIKEIKFRRDNPKEGSYTSYLFREGLDKILKKIGEESSEVIIGAKNHDKQELTSEMSDLIYHSLVLLEEAGVNLTDVKKELKNRRMKGDETKDE